LSGGIDSSSIAALASRFHYRRLTTLSVVFEEPDYSEAAYARLVAKQYGTDHREVLLRRKDFFEELPQIFDAMDQPSVDGVNSYFVSKAAREAELTVVLSGAGGDEVFLGYDHFKKTGSLGRARRFLGVLPLRARRTLLRAAVRAGFPSKAPGRERLAYLEAPSDENTYLLFRGLFAPRQIRDLLGISEREIDRSTQSLNLHPISTQSLNLSLSQSPSISTNLSISNSLLNSFTLFEFNHYLQNQVLKDIDAMSMAHSIETRVPFLDHRLVEYVAGVPNKTKLRNGINKPLLVKAMRDKLPKEIWNRPKMGFDLPLDRWMKERVDELEAMSLERKFLDPKAVKVVWKGFGENRVHWSQPWATMIASRFI
jgi:asparagine synthase (glutamine-hydrolysing)